MSREQFRPDEATKEQYEPPEVQSEEVFETLAISCVKATAQPCGSAPPIAGPLQS